MLLHSTCDDVSVTSESNALLSLLPIPWNCDLPQMDSVGTAPLSLIAIEATAGWCNEAFEHRELETERRRNDDDGRRAFG